MTTPVDTVLKTHGVAIPKDGLHKAANWWATLEQGGKDGFVWRVMRLCEAIRQMQKSLSGGDTYRAEMCSDEIVARFEYLSKTAGIQNIRNCVEWLKKQELYEPYLDADRAFTMAKGLIDGRATREKAKKVTRK